MLPVCICTAREASETPLSYLLPCTTQYMGLKGDQGDYKEESAFSECNLLTYFKTTTGGRYIPHPKRAFSSLLIILEDWGDLFSSEHLCFHQVNPMKGPETVTHTPLPRAEKETEHERTQRLVCSSEDVPEEEQDKSKLPPCTKPGAVITSGSIECYLSQP